MSKHIQLENRIQLIEKISSEQKIQNRLNEKVNLADAVTISMVKKTFMLANQLIILHKDNSSS